MEVKPVLDIGKLRRGGGSGCLWMAVAPAAVGAAVWLSGLI